MSVKGDKNGKQDQRSRVKSRSFKRTTADEKNSAAAGPASERFVKDVQTRGEAVKPDAMGKLPLSATHAITEEGEDGTAKQVKRARFKAF